MLIRSLRALVVASAHTRHTAVRDESDIAPGDVEDEPRLAVALRNATQLAAVYADCP